MSKFSGNIQLLQVRVALVAILSLSLLMFSSCGLPANKPSVKIVSPADLAAGQVTISVNLSNFELVADSGENISGEGHIVYYLDTPMRTYYDHSAASRAGTYAITNDTSYTWENVTPGPHTFSVQLVSDNDSPLPVLAVDSLTVTIGAPAGTPGILARIPADNSPLPPGNIYFSYEISNFIISKSGMGAMNRQGEGHLIYYLDETPPTDPGVPAVTDTSVVSYRADHLWKSVKEGTHTFSVQLVNNDDTPLATPVLSTLTIEIKP